MVITTRGKWSLSLRLIVFVCHLWPLESWGVPTLLRRFLLDRKVTFPDESQDSVDTHFMNMALSEARTAASRYNEVPIGAVVVTRNSKGYHVLSTASNRVESTNDASAHAELLALRKAGQVTQNWRLLNATLYTTLEPCPLCLSASLNFRVSRIVYGAPDHRLGAIETVPNSLIEQHPFHSIMDIRAGVLQNQSAELLQDFFRRRRIEKKGR